MSQAEVENTPFWLKDNFAPVFEETTAENLTVKGSIPRALNGRLSLEKRGQSANGRVTCTGF